MTRRRKWGPIGVTAGLTLTFAVLLGIGTVRPDAGGTPAPTISAAQPAAGPPWLRRYAPDELPPQFVLFSFDGAGSHAHWERIRTAAKSSNAHVTAFLSGVYLLPDARATEYTAPGGRPGMSAIGFGGTPDDVDTLVTDLNQARSAGHEIASHYNGHYCKGVEPATAWTTPDWTAELDQFLRLLDTAPGLEVDREHIKGARTPCLDAHPGAVLPVLAKHGMSYDASQLSEGLAWPVLRDGVWQFWVPQVRVPALKNRRVILMDYNLSQAMNRAKDEPGRAEEFATIALDTYRSAYQSALAGNRAPLVVGTHFTDWSGDAFTLATERFMAEVCTKPETVCATYSEVIDWMLRQNPAVLDALRALPQPEAT
ncbi:MAG TPA: polysaccharide deacetylase [Actinophytocola sp.]|uniref:polysaccharide deacetylase n=1 Tax=Actinophytocola sp. TaxID=1872138 RepID=UPI002DBFD968|nr:polysaccharide deacetylase [Actinophytocola sp.]HEU5469941.1 polysaccharide deacetylase [Actinophytocola sp.]